MEKEVKPGSLLSKTVYAFNIDERELKIEDYDLFIAKQEVVFSEGFKLKTVNREITEITQANIRFCRGPFTSIENALNSTELLVTDIGEVLQEENSFVLRIKDQLKMSPDLGALLTLKYKVALKGNGSRLFFCGCIQPSDYFGLRDYLVIENIRKEVKMVAFSRRNFEGWVFNASKPVVFPEGRMSKTEGV
ncbi:hypothetical protein KA005_54585, partial [bacterium]|nr:hypothetical protein [bacterium]